MRSAIIVLAVLASTAVVYGAENQAHEKGEAAESFPTAADLAPAMKEVKVSLADRLKAAEKEGIPICGKFEVEHGKLQLSVHTMKPTSFPKCVCDLSDHAHSKDYKRREDYVAKPLERIDWMKSPLVTRAIDRM